MNYTYNYRHISRSQETSSYGDEFSSSSKVTKGHYEERKGSESSDGKSKSGKLARLVRRRESKRDRNGPNNGKKITTLFITVVQNVLIKMPKLSRQNQTVMHWFLPRFLTENYTKIQDLLQLQ